MSIPTDDELVSSFKSFGFDDKKTNAIITTKKIAYYLIEILEKSNNSKNDDKKLNLLHQLAIFENKNGGSIPNIQFIISGIDNDELKSNLQIQEGINYLKSTESPSKSQFDQASGVGINITEDQVKQQISSYLDSISSELETKRYSIVSQVLTTIKNLPNLKWASPQLFKPLIDDEFLKRLGPKDERDSKKKEKKTKAKTEEVKETVSERNMFKEGFLGDLHKPGEEPQMYPELLENHKKFIQGQVYTRFPPEPNGFLHIGHSKAIMVNFGYAQYHQGKCYLRFDDTNPEAEEEKYFESIKEMVSWLGYSPFKITYSSDYFDELYQLAVKLIELDKAYVCFCTPEEMKLCRGIKEDGSKGGDRIACKHRSQSIEYNLSEFEKMKNGEYQVGQVTLRMKQDLNSPSPQMWDLVAYRVLNTPHHRTGSKWKIYPTYDFTHCLVDSFENITHSLCTTEFILSRESYEWLCDVLKVYRPAQREYGRLNLTGTIMSKRKIAKLVNDKYVRDWDDPRLYTLVAIKRRGIPPGAILSFINTLGVTTSKTNIQIVRFESAVRSFLDQTTPRLLMILNPIEVHIDNLPDNFELDTEIPYKPGKDEKNFGSRKLTFSNKIYIDRSDVKLESDSNFFRLAPGQPVGLMKVPFNISFNRIEGNILHVNYDDGIKSKPKTFIQWLPKSTAIEIDEVRIYNQLFKSEDPSTNPDGFLADINPDSEGVIKTALIEPNLKEIISKSPMNIEIPNSQFNIKESSGNNTVRFQALREGYFCLDKESNDEKLILNRIVTLKEDSNKSS
ncbi:unnamed protein product [Candida verbasci]|uniref:glutamine--tRNA ligase n=1 Tax=Candida verbasci TaxID=1227364 RepID=A0A9W4U0Z0_9ASCO|nr:unnamed protein product [Candida verbasci]